MRIDANNISEKIQREGTVHTKETGNIVAEQVKKAEKQNESSYSVKNVTYGKPFGQEKKSADELAAEAGMTDAELLKTQMVMLSNTTSSEDYAKLQEEGYGNANGEVPEIVTVMDKIKMELAKAGVDISIFGDDFSAKDIEDMTGSAAVASQIANALKAADLPQTTDNLEETEEALELAGGLETPTEAAIKYMLDNGLEPTIENLYMAEHSAVGDYRQPEEEAVDFDGLNDQIQKVLEENGYEVNDENMQDCKWLIEKGIPVTEQTLASYQDLKKLELPTDTKEVLLAITDAIADGKRPKDAILGITARRRLEEVRLEMSAKANYAHIGDDLAIDTESIAKSVEELKEAEDTYYKNILEQGGVEPTEENVDTYRQIEQTIDETKRVPAYTLGIADRPMDTVNDIHQAGKVLQDTFEKANESYEALMTAPRKDMGDSIQKAFRNVDAILEDNGLDITPENQRAVRILAYNRQDITPENIMKIKAIDEEVQQTFRNMTPQVVREMIKTGVNPLDMNLTELNEKALEIKQELNIDNEEDRFGKYLYKLEQNSEIAQEERSAYIGIYRLIAQVEKTDGAAIGMLAQQGAEMTMRNLITAVRSSKREGRDYKIDDEFGGLDSVEAKGISITDQIEAGYQKNCLKDVVRELSPERLKEIPNWESMTPEQLKNALEQLPQDKEAEEAYLGEQLSDYRASAASSEEIYQILEQYDLPKTVNTILAVQEMMTNRNGAFRKIFSQNGATDEIDLNEVQQQILEEFAEALKTPEDMAKAQQKLAEIAENAMKGMINETEVSSLDLKEMRLAKTQIELGTRMSKEETYHIPVLVGDSVTGVSLKIVRGKEERGRVEILFGNENIGEVAAQISVKGEKIDGVISAESAKTLEAFQKREDEFKAMLEQDSDKAATIHYVQTKEPQKAMGTSAQEKAVPEENEDTRVQTKTLYHMAESFIKVVQSIEV